MKKFVCLLLFFSLATVWSEETPLPSPTFPVEESKPAPEEIGFTWQLLNMLATLGLLIAVVLIASWFLKRMMQTRLQQVNLTSTIKILEQRALTTKTSIALIEVRGKEMAIAESVNGVTLLCQLTPEREES